MAGSGHDIAGSGLSEAGAKARKLVTVFVFLLIAAILAILTDRRLKSAPITGYHPQGVTWLVYSTDVSGFWRGLEQSPAYWKSAATGFPLVSDLQLRIRKTLGIRPTLERWQLWLGNRFVAARNDNGVGYCFRPGLALRVASLLHQPFADTADGVSAYRGLHYAWRDGFFIVSFSAAYVRAALRKNAEVVPQVVARASASIEWHSEPFARFQIMGSATLPVTGAIDVHFDAAQSPVSLVQPWSDSPILFAAGNNPGQVNELVEYLLAHVPEGPRLKAALAGMPELDLSERMRDARQFAFAVWNIDSTEFVPIPEVMLVLDPLSIGEPLAPPSDALPYEWNTIPGWAQPWLGEKLFLSVCESNGSLFLASRERVMARHLGPLTHSDSGADFVLRLEWSKVAAALRDALDKAAAHELIPRMNAEDVEREFGPVLDVLEGLGRVQLVGFRDNSGLIIQGDLTSTDEPDRHSPSLGEALQ